MSPRRARPGPGGRLRRPVRPAHRPPRARGAGLLRDRAAPRARSRRCWRASPKAIILSGGPSSVYAEGAPAIDGSIFEADVPVFGMCYGFQLMAQGLGGEVAATGAREYGRTPVAVERARHPAGRPPHRALGVDVARRLGDRGPVRLRRAGRDGGHARSRRSSRSTSGWPACSGTPRCCTPSTARRCSSTSCTTSPAAARPGRCSTSSRSRSSTSAPRSARAARSARCRAASTPPSPPPSCSARSATGSPASTSTTG